MNKFHWLIALAPLLMAGCHVSQPVATPTAAVSPKTLSLQQTSPQAIRIMASRITQEVGPGFKGYINLHWQQSMWQRPALQLEQQLIERGFSAGQILAHRVSGMGDSLFEGKGITISYLQMPPSRQQCRYDLIDWRFSNSEQLGCANRELLQRSVAHATANSF